MNKNHKEMIIKRKLAQLKLRLKLALIKRSTKSTCPEHVHYVYSQEGEDHLLWRIIGPSQQRPGTYVDVGCNHPWHYSNTGFFYERGWRGVAIDPNPEFESVFQESRPEDTFLNLGISDTTEKLTYYSFDISFYNTFSHEQAADLVDKKITSIVSKNEIGVETLPNALRRVWPDGKAIDLLSIDAENLDLKIVQGHDFDNFPVSCLFIEIDFMTLDKVMDTEIVRFLKEKDYIVVSKLYKSILLFHSSKCRELGMDF